MTLMIGNMRNDFYFNGLNSITTYNVFDYKLYNNKEICNVGELAIRKQERK